MYPWKAISSWKRNSLRIYRMTRQPQFVMEHFKRGRAAIPINTTLS